MKHSSELVPETGAAAARPLPEQEQASAGAGATLHQAGARYQALYMALEQAFCVMEKVATAPGEPSDYRCVAVNHAFVQHAGLPDAPGKTLRQLLPGAAPRLAAACDDAVASGTPRHCEEYVAHLGAWIAAEVLPDPQPGRLAVLFGRVPARRRAAQGLRESEVRQSYLLALSDALRPVRDAGTVQATATHAALHYFEASRCYYGEVEGDTVTIRRDAARPGLPSVAAVCSRQAMPLFGQLLPGQLPVVVASVPMPPALADGPGPGGPAGHAQAYIVVPVVRQGEQVGVLCLTQSTPREWTAPEVALLQETAERTAAALERARAENALRRSEEEFRSLVTTTSDTVYKMSSDWCQMHLLLGKNFLADTPGTSSAWIERYIPATDQPLVQATIEAAIQAKSVFELEHRVIQADGQVGWVYSRALPVLDAQGTITEWLGTAQDVTARKQAEAQLRGFTAQLERQVAERTQALQESRDLLHTVAESQTVTLSAFKAVRDEQNQLLDLACIFTSTRAEPPAAGRPVVGQRYLGQFPEAERARLLAAYRRIIDAGLTQEQEFARAQGPQLSWFRTISTKLGDGVLVSEEDITARKQAEQERTKVLRLLEQSEEVANMGSWDYELATGRVTWSAGMYRLFGLEPGYPTTPPHYLDLVVEEDRPIAQRLVGSLRAGASAFTETLRLRVGPDVKTVRVQARLLPGEAGQPGRILGVDVDLSTVQRLEAENQALRLDQQQALVLAILQAQEAERNRLAESLHNGLGQLLYATKLQAGQLDVPALHKLPALNGVRSHIDHLLSEAIRQTRTLAHDLMPTALAEQGLGPALRAVCRGLTTPRLQFACHVWLDAQVLPPPLQTAVYRLAQELAHNVAKHAEASRAVLEFEMMPGWVSLRAEDNGRGFDPAATPKGLGLRLLHDAVGLLGGTMLLDSSPEYGTHIRLRIPIIP